MTDRLVRQMEEKELEAKQKEDFTAAFAHELKTPLTSIIGYADMLNSYELTEQERGEAPIIFSVRENVWKASLTNCWSWWEWIDRN